MPRDINGVYTLPAGNPVVPGTVISTNWANATMTDIAAALTASITQTAADARYLRLTGGTLTGGLTIPSLNGGQLAGMRNKIINGKMEIAQRGISVSLTASGQFSLDRWRHAWDGSGAARVATRQEFVVGTGPETIRNFLSYVQSAAGSGGTFNSLEQLIEGVDNFAGQTVTLSFYARNNAATPLPQIICRQFFGTGGSATVNTTVATNVATTASFTRYVYTFTVPSIVGKTVAGGNDFLGILILLPVNSVFAFDITGVQLEAGAVATPFEHRPYGQELALCMRYYEKSYDIDMPAGSLTNAGASTSIQNTVFLLAAGTTRLKVSKRATPTITAYSCATGSPNVLSEYDAGSVFIADRSISIQPAKDSFYLLGTGTLIIGNFSFFQWTADAEL